LLGSRSRSSYIPATPPFSPPPKEPQEQLITLIHLFAFDTRSQSELEHEELYISCIDPFHSHCLPLSSVPHPARLPERHMRQAMPPRSSLTSSFSASTDANNEVVCPLSNADGSHCRKRCLGVSASHSRSRSRSCPAMQCCPALCCAVLCCAVLLECKLHAKELGGNKRTSSNRRSVIGRCKNIYEERIPSITSLSFQLPRKAFSR